MANGIEPSYRTRAPRLRGVAIVAAVAALLGACAARPPVEEVRAPDALPTLPNDPTLTPLPTLTPSVLPFDAYVMARSRAGKSEIVLLSASTWLVLVPEALIPDSPGPASGGSVDEEISDLLVSADAEHIAFRVSYCPRSSDTANRPPCTTATYHVHVPAQTIEPIIADPAVSADAQPPIRPLQWTSPGRELMVGVPRYDGLSRYDLGTDALLPYFFPAQTDPLAGGKASTWHEERAIVARAYPEGFGYVVWNLRTRAVVPLTGTLSAAADLGLAFSISGEKTAVVVASGDPQGILTSTIRIHDAASGALADAIPPGDGTYDRDPYWLSESSVAFIRAPAEAPRTSDGAPRGPGTLMVYDLGPRRLSPWTSSAIVVADVDHQPGAPNVVFIGGEGTVRAPYSIPYGGGAATRLVSDETVYTALEAAVRSIQ